MKQERYEQIDSQFWIFDPELGLDLQGAFVSSEKGYFNTGQLRYISCYEKNNQLHGSSVFYDKSGMILTKKWYFAGEKTGKSYQFFPSGALYSLERFVAGLFHLAQEYYYIDGSLKTKVHYDQGTLDGETLLFWPDGTLKRKCYFSQGKKEIDEFFDEEGDLIGDIEAALS